MANSWAILKYGPITFDFRDTIEVQTEMVFNDNRTYLHTRWTFNINAVLGPDLTSYQKAPGAPPVATPGQLPTPPHEIIRHELTKPRQTLVYANGPNVLLQAPAPGYDQDANLGPVVEKFDIVAAHGVQTFVVNMRIVACVIECESTNPLVSHTWKTWVDYDQDFYCAGRVVEGTVVFRGDILKRLGTFPDQYRQNFMFPVPPNMRRLQIRIIQEEDGLTYHYQTIDQEASFNLLEVPGGPVRFEGFFTAGYEQFGRGDAMLDLAASQAAAALELAAGFAGAAAKAAPLRFGMAGAAAAHGLSGLAASVGIVRDLIPKCFAHCQVRAWGNSKSTRIHMIKWCLGVALSRMVGNGLALDPYHTNLLQITEQLNGKYVEVDITQRWPASVNLLINPLQGAGERIGNWAARILGFQEDLAPAGPLIKLPEIPGAGLNIVLERMGGEEINREFRGVHVVVTRDPRVQNPEIFKGRGNFFTNLLAQALSAPCHLPPPPPPAGPATYNPNMDKSLYGPSNP